MTANALVGLSHNAVAYRNMRLHQEHEVNRAYVEQTGPWSKQRLPQWFAIRSVIFLLFGMAEALFNLQSLFFAVVYLILNAVSLVGVHLTGQAMNKVRSELMYYKR